MTDERDGRPRTLKARCAGAAGVVLREFELGAVIGRGGMGVVHRAKNRNAADGEPPEVAIKYLETKDVGSNALGELMKRFARETKLARRVSHPNIIRVYAHGIDQQGQPFLAMQYIDGAVSLAYLIDKAKKQLRTNGKIMSSLVRLSRLLRIWRQIVSALIALHAHGIVHRDLKPENVLVVEEDCDHVYLIDFGIAKALDPDSMPELKITVQHTIIGTPDYMPPEQIRGFIRNPLTKEDHHVGTPSDVYALGVTMYESVTGDLPYTVDCQANPSLQQRAIIGLISEESCEPRPMTDFVIDLDAKMKKLIERCMSFSPWLRPTLEEVDRELQELELEQEQHQARASYSTAKVAPSPEPPKRAWRTARLPSEEQPSTYTDPPPTADSVPKTSVAWVVFPVVVAFIVGVVALYALSSDPKTVAPQPQPSATASVVLSATASAALVPTLSATAVIKKAPPPPQPTATAAAISPRRQPGPGPSDAAAKKNFAAGEKAFNTKDYRTAKLEMARTLAVYPTFPAPFRILAESHLRTGNIAEAHSKAAEYLEFEGTSVTDFSPELQASLAKAPPKK